MASRALPDLIARIRLDSSGVDESLAGLTKSFSRTNIEMGLAAGGIAGIVGIAKSFIGITEAMDNAQSDLANAYHGNADSLKNYRAQIADFIDANQGAISNNAEVVEGFATLTRQGGDATRVTRDMGIALDLAAATHKPLTEAVALLAAAEEGRFKGLIGLGINIKGINKDNADALATTKDVIKATDEQRTAQKNLDDAQRALLEFETGMHEKKKITALDLLHEQDAKKKVADATDALKTANDNLATAQKGVKGQTDAIQGAITDLAGTVDHARDNHSKLEDATNHLGGAWDKLATVWGPPFLDVLTKGATFAADLLTNLGDPKKWAGISSSFAGLAVQLKQIMNPNWNPNWSPTWATDNNLGGAVSGVDPNHPQPGGKAGGGPVMPNGVYTIGEHGPETLVMGRAGGMVYPGSTGAKASGGMTINVTVMGSVQTERNLALAIREGIRQLDRAQR